MDFSDDCLIGVQCHFQHCAILWRSVPGENHQPSVGTLTILVNQYWSGVHQAYRILTHKTSVYRLMIQ